MKKKNEQTSTPIPIRKSFIAANGYNGFRSRYKEVFNSQDFEHIFVLKGGPGTGKSYTLQEFANAGIKAGAACEYIYCSSDPESLDGVILEKNRSRIAMLDGTAPHTRCADFPGIIDEIVDLGNFWDKAALKENRDEIYVLSQKKSLHYHYAYRYLRIAGEADAFLKELVSKCLLVEKMCSAAQREVRHLSSDNCKCAKEEVRYINACSMRGYMRLPVPSNVKTISISDHLFSARFYLVVLRDLLRKIEGISFCIYPSCYSDEDLEGIYLPQNNILYLKNGESCERNINMKRFLSPQQISLYREDIRRTLKLRNSMQEQACASLREAGRYHFALEKLYGTAMDFSKKELYTKNLVQRAIAYLSGGR